MCTRTNTTTSKLLSAYCGYVDQAGMGDPASVSFVPTQRQISIQPQVKAHDDPVAVLSALLLWSRNLTGVTADWVRTDTDSLHITISGRLASGIRLQIYSAFPYERATHLVYLEHELVESVSLDELGFLAAELHSGTPATT